MVQLVGVVFMLFQSAGDNFSLKFVKQKQLVSCACLQDLSLFVVVVLLLLLLLLMLLFCHCCCYYRAYWYQHIYIAGAGVRLEFGLANVNSFWFYFLRQVYF